MKLSPKGIAIAASSAVVLAAAAAGAHLIYHRTPRPKVATITDGEGTPIRVLKVGDTFQSATYVDKEKRSEPVLEYYRTFDVLFDFGKSINSVLMLGAGGCAWPSHVVADHPDVKVDAVEASPKIAKLAKSHFFVDDLSKKENFTLHVADALEFLVATKEDGTTYSAIVNDCFDGKKPEKSLCDKSALKLVHDCLEDGGLYLVNVTSSKGKRSQNALKKTTKALNKTFKHVYTFPCTDEEFGQEDNFVLVATDGDYQIEQ